MNKIIIFPFCLFVSITIFSQTFTGTVLDKATKEPVSFAQVYFVDLKTGTTTGEQGVFKIENFNQTSIHIQISYIGYNTIDEIITIDSVKEKTFYLEQSHLDLEEIMISVPKGQLQGEHIVNVTHKNITELEQTSSLTLAETISHISGVEQATTGAGIGKPVIRGLSGNRIVTYAQGIRLENQQWGNEHGLGVGEVGIESVEVIKGPASLLYGSDAIGGVLYFIDERYAIDDAVEIKSGTKFLSNTLGSVTDVGLKIHKNKLKFNLFGNYASHTDYKTPKSNRVFNTRFDEKNIKTAIGFNVKNWISNIRYSFLRNNYGIVEDVIFTNDTERKFESPYQTIDNHNVTFENTLFIKDSKLDVTLGYTHNYRKEFEDHHYEEEVEDDHEDEEEEDGHQAIGLKLKTLSYNLKWYSPVYNNRFDVILGFQGIFQNNKNNGEEVLIPDAKTNDFGAFAIANYKINKLQLQGGLRTDFREIDTDLMLTEDGTFPALKKSYNGITFSAGLVYKLEKTKYRVNVSSGFRAPNTTELLSEGVHHGTNQYIKGDDSLSSEQATQIDFTFEYKDEHFQFSINPFYNSIKDYIYLVSTNTFIEDNPVFEYTQTDAFLYGGEMGFHYHPHKIHWLHIESNLSTVIAEDKDGAALPLIPQTKLNTIMRAEISHKGKLRLKNLFIEHIHKFEQNRTGVFETNTNDYSLINTGFNLEIKTKKNPIIINGGIKNLFNKKYIDHLSHFKTLEISNQGINFYTGVKVKLD